MRTFIHDRYLVTGPDRARDLATGRDLPLESVKAPADVRSTPTLEPFFDALDHAREGEPQWRTLRVRDLMDCRTLTELIAEGAQRRGYVPVAVRLYDQVRRVLTEELCDRAFVLIDGGDSGLAAKACFMEASAGSARPHMLVTLRQPRRSAGVVREAHALFGAAAGREMPAGHPEVVRLLARAARAPEFVRSGRHAAAERMLREVMAALERRRAYGEAAKAGLDLGRILFERGRVSEADTCGGYAAHLADLVRDSALTCEAHLLQAWSRLEQVRVTEAESISRAVLLCSPGESLSACARATLARCLLEQGRLRELREMDLSVQGGLALDARWRAIIDDVAVAVLMEIGRLFEAGRRIRAALDACCADTDPLATLVLHTAHLRVVVSTGDLALAESVLERALTAAGLARAPLRALRARAVWCAGLARAGSAELVGTERARLRRLLSVAPPMIVREVEAAGRYRAAGRQDAATESATSMTATMIALAQEDEDAEAVRAVLGFALKELDAARVDVVSGDAGPPSTLATVGGGPGPTVGARVLESGIAVGFETGSEAGVPVRLGSRQVAALVARWPSGRALPVDRKAVLECAAAVMAARVDGIQHRARESAAASVEIPELIGVGLATTELRKAVMRAARAPFSVLIEGESGVGKELVARAIHHLSSRRERRFCDVNCAALPDDLFETELFGHAKGAFTGAVAERAGLFEEASGGTLFLDEVADLSLRAQAKLLRAVQQQEVRRVGESFARSVDVRFVAAANRQMAGEVEAGRFRTDLLYRLDVIHIRIAPLRERPEDIPVIARHLWSQAAARVGSSAALTPGALAALTHYSWPGNVRELQNVIAALAVAAPPRGRVRAALLPPVISTAVGVSAGELAPARDQFERRFVELALARTGGNRTRAARALGLSRQGLLKSMVRLGLSPSHDD